MELDTILVPVKVEPGNRILTFALDTGAEMTTIDEAAAKTLQLPPRREIDAETVGGEQRVPTVQLDLLQFGPLQYDSLTVAAYDLVPLAAALDANIDGVIGIDILSRFPFTVDYTKKEIEIWQSGIVSANGHVFRVPIRHDKGGYLVKTRINHTSDIELLLDTGTNMTQFSWNNWQVLTHDWQPSKLLKGVDSTGHKEHRSFLVRLPSLEMRQARLKNQVVRVIGAISAGTFADPDAPGLLGADILRHFIVTVDIPHEQMLLAPDPKYKPEPLEFTTIGIQFLKRGKAYYVTSVWEGSPADELHIQRGDEILEVQGEAVSSLSSEELYRLLHGPQGSMVTLKLRRGDKTLLFRVPRRQLL